MAQSRESDGRPSPAHAAPTTNAAPSQERKSPSRPSPRNSLDAAAVIAKAASPDLSPPPGSKAPLAPSKPAAAAAVTQKAHPPAPPPKSAPAPKASATTKVEAASLLSRLPPLDGSSESSAKREKVFKSFDMNGNGFLSLAELDKGLTQILRAQVPKPVTMRAFQASKDAHKSSNNSVGGDYVERSEFRLFFIWIRRYYELWQVFDSIDTGRE